MPLYSFDLERQASSDGIVQLNDTFPLPIQATVIKLEFQTVELCDSRKHSTALSVIGPQGSVINLPNEEIQDCTLYALPLRDIKLVKGQYVVSVSSVGFGANEVVKLKGTLTYKLDIFFAEIQGITESDYLT